MINFNREQKADALDNLPKDLKAVVMSSTLATTFQKIGEENRLPIDKAGILSELVIVTILGLLPREELRENIKREMGLNDLQASTLTKSVNENIFLKIREILQQEENFEKAEEIEPEHQPKKTPVAPTVMSESPEIHPERDQILAEIENPTPVAHPISIVDQTIPGPAKQTEIIAKEFIAGKLNETVSLPRKTYNVDPYREPIS